MLSFHLRLDDKVIKFIIWYKNIDLSHGKQHWRQSSLFRWQKNGCKGILKKGNWQSWLPNHLKINRPILMIRHHPYLKHLNWTRYHSETWHWAKCANMKFHLDLELALNEAPWNTSNEMEGDECYCAQRCIRCQLTGQFANAEYNNISHINDIYRFAHYTL